LLETAKAAFSEKGSAASLDEIARIAGVGAGTLYRHFPTRDALVAAVYRNETEQLVAAADRLAQTHPPVMALREWLLLFVDYIATKHGMYEVLNSIVFGVYRTREAGNCEAGRVRGRERRHSSGA
jgi:AcrR family transcriptional regulator